MLLELTPRSSRQASTPWYTSPATEPPASPPPFTPRKKQKVAFSDALSSPAVPSSQTQELFAFDSPTVRTSPAVRSSQPQPLHLLETPTSAHASPIVASSQTQALCMFDTPTRRRTSPSQSRMFSDGDHEDIEIVPSSQAEQFLFDSLPTRNPHLKACPPMQSVEFRATYLHTVVDCLLYPRSASTGDTAIELPASPIPVVPSLDSPFEAQVESRTRSTEHLPPATPSEAPILTSPPDSPLQEEHSQQSDNGNLADHSLPDSHPIFDSQPGIGLPGSQSSNDASQAGAMVISDFFNIFDEGGGSLPADFPIPLW